MLHRSMKFVAALALAGGVFACSSEPVATLTEDDEALAVALDGMEQDAARQGDGDGMAAFGAAAIAVRLGVRPGDLAVSVDGDVRRYRAFVHVVRRTRENVSVEMRTLVALRPGDRDRPLEILYVALSADSADFGPPAVTDRPAAHGVSSWKDLTVPQFYLATRGFGQIENLARIGPCPKVSDRANVTCTVATFGTRLHGVYQALIGNQRGQLSDRRVEIQSRGDVPGAVLSFE